MNPPGLDDILVQAARRGSDEAFSRLVARHQQALRAFLRRTCGDWSLADDLAQETFIAAWSSLGQLKAGASVRAWLCGIGYRKALTALRSAGRSRRREQSYASDPDPSSSPDPTTTIALDRAMATLSPAQRSAVALCLAADFSHAEAAEALGLPLGTVKSHLARGRAVLLLALEKRHD